MKRYLIYVNGSGGAGHYDLEDRDAKALFRELLDELDDDYFDTTAVVVTVEGDSIVESREVLLHDFEHPSFGDGLSDDPDDLEPKGHGTETVYDCPTCERQWSDREWQKMLHEVDNTKVMEMLREDQCPDCYEEGSEL